MRPLKYVVVFTTLASAIILAQTPAGNARTYTGSVINADCSQAGILASSAAATPDKDNKSVYDKQREVLKHCSAGDKSTAFAVLTDDGTFYKLDEAGNSQVTTLAGSDKEKKKNLKNLRVTVTGIPQGDTLKVQSLAKTDKPFGAS